MGQVGATLSWPESHEGSEIAFCRPRKLGLPILEEGHCGSYTHTSGVGCAGIIGGPSLICKVWAIENKENPGRFLIRLFFRTTKEVQ